METDAIPRPDGPGTPERRAPIAGDRRRRPTGPWSAFRGGRRRGPRRADERSRPHFVDRVSPGAAALALLLLALSMADALATIALLDSGCVEANPAMRCLLGYGAGAFLGGKMALTASGLLVILTCRHHHLFTPSWRVGHLLPGLAGVYGAVNAYEVVLLLTI